MIAVNSPGKLRHKTQGQDRGTHMDLSDLSVVFLNTTEPSGPLEQWFTSFFLAIFLDVLLS